MCRFAFDYNTDYPRRIHAKSDTIISITVLCATISEPSHKCNAKNGNTHDDQYLLSARVAIWPGLSLVGTVLSDRVWRAACK